MSVPLLLAIGFGVGATFVMLIAPIIIHRERRLAREGRTTTGTVVRVEENFDSGFTASIEYCAEGLRRSFSVATQFDGLSVGQVVRVRYLPQAPEHAAIDEGGPSFAGTITVLLLAAAFWAVTALLMFGFWRQ